MAFFPKRWVSFDDATHVPLVRFSALLGIDSRVKITREENETLIRFTEKSELPAENRFCENRWIDVDPLTGCVIGYGYSGGGMGTQSGQLKWKKNGSDWYASEGTITTNGIVDVHWTIDECTYDAKAVRKSFEIKDSDVPFATRITENANSTQKGKGLGKTRFVGGDEGKREHDLRIAAMRIESAKK